MFGTEDASALKDTFAGDFFIGCILSYKHIGSPDDPRIPGASAVVAPEGGKLVKRHMNSMTPGNNMKPEHVLDLAASAKACAEATTDEGRCHAEVHPVVAFNADLVAQLDWAKRNAFVVRGHVLVWHWQTPKEFFRSSFTLGGSRLDKELMAERLNNYIGEVIQHIHERWPGLLVAMDVVNEAISNFTGKLRRRGCEWYETFGDDSYVMKAFESARKHATRLGETQMKLYYNDYFTSSRRKANGIVRLCAPIFKAGYLDGIGMQEHDWLWSPSAKRWIASYDKFYPICSEMSVTELSVSGPKMKRPPKRVLERGARQYASLFKCFADRSARSGRGKIVNITLDGLNDEFAFFPNTSSSLWDSSLAYKPAFFAVSEIRA